MAAASTASPGAAPSAPSAPAALGATADEAPLDLGAPGGRQGQVTVLALLGRNQDLTGRAAPCVLFRKSLGVSFYAGIPEVCQVFVAILFVISLGRMF